MGANLRGNPPLAPLAFLTLCLSLLAGCAVHRNSDHPAGEVVLTLNPNTERDRTVASGAIGALVDVAVDLVKGAIETEAAKLERQYGQVDYRSDFWSIVVTATNTVAFRPNYAGFTLRRLTKDYPRLDNPAMQLDCAFELSDGGRMFLIRPTQFVLRQAKAKVINPDGRINIAVDIAVDAMWIDKTQTARQSRIASSTFDIADYDLSRTDLRTDFKGQMAGWFPGVPVSAGPDGKYPWDPSAVTRTRRWSDGCFKLTVLVTERDASRAKEHLERTARYIGTQKSLLIEKAEQAIE